MNGELAQCCALAAHGSAWLAGPDAGPPPELADGNSTFRSVRAATFAGAPGVGAWLGELAADGVDRIWLAVRPAEPVDDGRLEPHRRAAFGAGLPAGLLTTGATGSQLWRATWSVGDQGARDRRSWDVAYHPVAVGPDLPRIASSVDHAAAVLDGVLERAIGFSRAHGLDPWPEHFAAARKLRYSKDFTAPYHQDLFPANGYDVSCRRLGAMVQAAWVFGGMGSWNDLSLAFDDADVEAEYEELSRTLFSAVMRAAVAAVNAPLAGAGRGWRGTARTVDGKARRWLGKAGFGPAR